MCALRRTIRKRSFDSRRPKLYNHLHKAWGVTAKFAAIMTTILGRNYFNADTSLSSLIEVCNAPTLERLSARNSPLSSTDCFCYRRTMARAHPAPGLPALLDLFQTVWRHSSRC